MITLAELIDLIPESVYNERKNTDSNIYKMAYVLWYVFNYLDTILTQVRNNKEIASASGKNLELWAGDYGLTRDSMSDDELRVRLSAKIAKTVNGNTIPGIINILVQYVSAIEDLLLTEFSDLSLGYIWDGSSMWDGSITWSGSGLIQWRAFDVNLSFVSGLFDPVLGAAIDDTKEFFKPAGIFASVTYF